MWQIIVQMRWAKTATNDLLTNFNRFENTQAKFQRYSFRASQYFNNAGER